MASWLRRIWPFGWSGVFLAFVATSTFLVATFQLGTWPWLDRRPLRERYLFRQVSRSDLSPVLNAPGRLESSKRTVVRCELENIAGGASGTGSSILLTLAPEGTAVKAGDVLATLDASATEEMYRQQIITVEQAKASHLQAQLNHQITLLAVREYRDGTVQETLKGMEGSIALARSDLSRAMDHLDWTKRMKEKGYSSPAQIVSEQHSVTQLDMSLKKQITSLELFQRFTQPKTEMSLRGQVTTAQTNLNNETLRLQRQTERLALLKKQVERCTIRAPHDGVLFYYKEGQRPVAIEEGMTVRQKQPLFYLPDLTEMEVAVALNQSVVDRVSIGQRTRVRFEALPNLVLDGRVVSISQIPVQQNDRGEDIRYFMSLVKLDSVAPGLKPGMSTRVDIALARRAHVLAIPHQALQVNEGRKVCYVAHEENLERREVKTGQDTTEMIEVLEGLAEGELVALNPPPPSKHVESLMNFDEIHVNPATDADTVTASQH